MVKLTKIYTKYGDDGDTMLGDGSATRKTDPRVEAYGTVDEANAVIGVAISLAGGTSEDGAARMRDELRRIQNDLFDVGADLCTPAQPDEAPGKALRITSGQTARLERLIDEFNKPLGALESFVLPGGTSLAANLHLARTVVRRAERRVAILIETGSASREVQVYLNRLSDLLFVLARVANDNGRGDVLWKPGATRDETE